MSSLAGTRRADDHSLRPVALVSAGFCGATALGSMLGAVWPALAPGHPHPTLHVSVGPAAAILAQNARVLAAPFLLAALGLERARWSRVVGDALVIAILGGNAVLIGVALGRFGGSLIPYLPHVPVEYLAAVIAAGAWVDHRHRPLDARELLLRAALTLLLLAAAAAIEVLATPHAR